MHLIYVLAHGIFEPIVPLVFTWLSWLPPRPHVIACWAELNRWFLGGSNHALGVWTRLGLYGAMTHAFAGNLRHATPNVVEVYIVLELMTKPRRRTNTLHISTHGT